MRRVVCVGFKQGGLPGTIILSGDNVRVVRTPELTEVFALGFYQAWWSPNVTYLSSRDERDPVEGLLR